MENSTEQRLAIIDADGWLSKAEKPEIWRQSEAIRVEHSGLLARYPDLAGLDEMKSLCRTGAELINYLDALRPPLDDFANDTEINASKFMDLFTAHFSARSDLYKHIG